MLKPSSKKDVNQRAYDIVAIATGTRTKQQSVMAQMGSKGGKVGGRRRAENMSPEARRAAASLAAKARWGIKEAPEESAEAKRDAALRKIASILEDHMTDLGLAEAEKDQKTSELVDMVGEAVKAKLKSRAKPSSRLQIAASQA